MLVSRVFSRTKGVQRIAPDLLNPFQLQLPLARHSDTLPFNLLALLLVCRWPLMHRVLRYGLRKFR